jgi:hypothetical protein
MTHSRSTLHAIAIAALLGTGVGAQAATTHEPAPVRWIEGDAVAQARLESGIARDKVAPTEVAALESRAADLYRDQADALAAPLTPSARSEVAAAESGLTHAVDHAVWSKHAAGRENPMDRMHEQVASMRDAEQQRWIANGLEHDRLTPTQVSALERNQADLVQSQAGMARQGHESVDDALRMQHQQDIQDWAIRTAHVDAGTNA